MVRNALIAGGTGLTGSELVKKLIRSDYYNSLHLVGRRPHGMDHEKVRSYTIDFDHLEEFSAEAVIHDVYICLGTTIKKAGSQKQFSKVDRDYVVNLGKWAMAHKVQKMAVISSMGARASSRNFYLRTKGEMEEGLASLGLPSLVILRPSLLLGYRQEFRLGEKVASFIMPLFHFLMVGKLKKYRAVKSSIVAEAMFKGLLHAEKGVTVMENEGILWYGER